MTPPRSRLTAVAALVALALGLSVADRMAPRAAAQAVFSTPLNTTSSTLAVNHALGSGTLVVKAGDGPAFGTPAPTAPVRVTVARRSTLSNGQASGAITPATARTIFLVTGRTGDTLTGLTAVEGTADQAFTAGDPVAVLITAGMLVELQSAVAAGDADAVHKTTPNETITGLKAFQAPATTSATIASASLTAGVATFTTASPHGFAANQTVTVAGLSNRNNGTNTYALNGTYLIAATPTTTTFTCAVAEADVAATVDAGTATAATDHVQFQDAAGARLARVNPLAVRFDQPVQVTQRMDFRAPPGGVALAIYALNTAFPYNLATVIGTVGNLATGTWILITQNRNPDGTHQPIGNEPSMLAVASDVNGPTIQIQGGSASPLANAIAIHDGSDNDGNFPPGPYSGGTGKRKLVIRATGEHLFGTDLGIGIDPAQNAAARFYLDTSNSAFTIAAPFGFMTPGSVLFGEQALNGDGSHPYVVVGKAGGSPTIAGYWQRKLPAASFHFGAVGEAGGTVLGGNGGLTVQSTAGAPIKVVNAGNAVLAQIAANGTIYSGDTAGGNYVSVDGTAAGNPVLSFLVGGVRKTVLGYGSGRYLAYADAAAMGLALFDTGQATLGPSPNAVGGNQLTVDKATTGTAVLVAPQAAGAKGLVVQGFTAHTANLTEWQDSTTAVMAKTTKDGVQVAKGFASAIAGKTAAYTVTTADGTITANATTAAFAVTLPAASAVTPGRTFTVKKTDASANAVTVTRAGADTIDGATTLALSAQWQFATVQSDGVSSWFVVAH